MSKQGDLRVIACNYLQGTNVVSGVSDSSMGALAYVVLAGHSDKDGYPRLEVLVRSRGSRWITKWEDIRRLYNFRSKTIPVEHALYGQLISACPVDDEYIVRLNRVADENRERRGLAPDPNIRQREVLRRKRPSVYDIWQLGR